MINRLFIRDQAKLRETFRSACVTACRVESARRVAERQRLYGWRLA